MGGFTMIPNWVVRRCFFSTNELAVYIALLGRVDNEGVTFPSVSRIAKESGLSQSTARRTLKGLEVRQVVRIERRPRPGQPHQTNRYYVQRFPLVDPHIGEQEGTGAGCHPGRDWVPSGQGVPVSVADEEYPLEEEPVEGELEGHPADDPREQGWPLGPNASVDQVSYLCDLHILYDNEAPSVDLVDQWRKLTAQDASRLIGAYLASIERGSDYRGAFKGDEAYELLSLKGRAWADAGMVPQEVRLSAEANPHQHRAFGSGVTG